MTNTEDTNTPAASTFAEAIAEAAAQDEAIKAGFENSLSDLQAYADEHPGCSIAEGVAATLLNVVPGFVETVATMDGHYDQPAMAYRYLNWLHTNAKPAAHNADLSGFSQARRDGMADLVRNGLVVERVYTGGLDDGRRTLELSALGSERLAAAWEAAALIVVG